MVPNGYVIRKIEDFKPISKDHFLKAQVPIGHGVDIEKILRNNISSFKIDIFLGVLDYTKRKAFSFLHIIRSSQFLLVENSYNV